MTTLGGAFNIANDDGSAVTGGCANLAGTGPQPASTCGSNGMEGVSGGISNVAGGFASSVSGGETDSAFGLQSWVSGAFDNSISSGGVLASVVDGEDNSAVGRGGLAGGDARMWRED